MPYKQFLTKFLVAEDLHMLLFLLLEKGPRATKISWRAALWPCLNYKPLHCVNMYLRLGSL